MFKGRTIKRAFARVGPGVHTGIVSRVEVRPAEPGQGLWFRSAQGDELPVHVSQVRSVPGSTVLAQGDWEVRTPEHLLAALVAHQITDATLVLEGPEVPILDGSALPWCEAIAEAGTEGVLPEALTLPEVVVHSNGGTARSVPGPVLRVEVDVAFPGGPSGRVAERIPGRFCERVAHARTFALERDVERLRAQGRGAGATLENTVIWGEDGAINALRCEDEPVRHKLVDLVGDLALVGTRVTGTVSVDRPSHALHHAFIREILRA